MQLTLISMSNGVRKTVENVEDYRAAITALRQHLQRALGGARIAVPGMPGCRITAKSAGRARVVTITPTQFGTLPLLTVATAVTPDDGFHLWEVLHRTSADLATSPDEGPEDYPWVAERLEPGAEKYPEVLPWLTPFAIATGFAWLEIDAASAPYPRRAAE